MLRQNDSLLDCSFSFLENSIIKPQEVDTNCFSDYFFFYIKHLHVKHKKYSHQYLTIYLTDIPRSKKRLKYITSTKT